MFVFYLGLVLVRLVRPCSLNVGYFIRFSTLARSLTVMSLYLGILFHSSHVIAAMFYVCCILFGLSTPMFYVYVGILRGY